MPEATVFPGAAALQPESPARPAPGPVVTFTVLPGLAVKAVLPRGADLNETAASQLYSRLGELAGDRRVAVVLDVTGVKSINRAVRAAYAAIPSVSAWAILGESPVDRLLGHFLLGGEFSSVPARYFSAETDALDWLSRLDDVL
ncbi:DUF7793 family protein [Arthrobacter globiformis]|uniref:DUF7793 family protein n=1 Tax=Arthrobacter globiformis TaxID=1665 RepID=UPI0027948B93|nr:hypothetical protein [Arthrobacter globiformis]MDQ0620239.1 hypothetical protein [Arthrobacter globiformis]